MKNISKQEFINKIADKTEVSKSGIGNVLNAILDTIQEEVSAGNKVSFVGFGSFEQKDRAARKGHNPQTGKEILIPARKVPVFKAGKVFKDSLK